MNFRAEIDVMPLKELLDPQGKAVEHGLQKMNFKEVEEGKETAPVISKEQFNL